VNASQVGDITSAASLLWLQQHGADPSTIKMTEMPFSQMGPSLERGAIAAATISEPSLTNAIRSGQARSFGKLFDVIAPHFMIGGWFAKSSWIEKNRDVAKRYAEVIYRTAKWANANAEKSAEILGHYSKIPLSSLKVMTRCKYGESFPEVYVTAPIELAVKAKLIAKPIPASQIIAKI
jgi:NitT/TauT family transport system substrate-binding protein